MPARLFTWLIWLPARFSTRNSVRWLRFSIQPIWKDNTPVQPILLYTLWVFTIETWRVSIADSCTFHLNLTCRNVTNHCLRASIPLIHGSRGQQCHYSLLKGNVCKLRYIVANVLWRNDQTISISINYAPLSYRTGGNRKRSEQSMNADHRSLETVFWRQTPVESSVSSDLGSMFVDSINVFDCLLSEVFI